MSIFKLSQVKQVSDKPVPLEAVNNNNLQETNEKKEVTGLSGEPSKVEDKQLVLDGPLSNIYTQALNIVYAKEGITDMIKDGDGGTDTNPESTNDLDTDLYVYATDSNSLDNGGLVESTNKLNIALDNKNAKHVLLVVEHNGNINNKFVMLENFAKDKGIKITTSRSKAIEQIVELLKG